MTRPFLLVPIVLASFSVSRAAPDDAPPLATLMPRAEDYALMSWADGFPGHTPGLPWLRVIQTGRYAVVLDTESLQIPHLGGVDGNLSYLAAARSDNLAWQGLPAADLRLTLTANCKTHRCTAGGKWSRFAGPRLIESGRFLQRADVTDLEFSAGDGAKLNAEARFETVAWPDRLALIFAARPGLQPISPGESSFGRVGGGFGLHGTNHLDVPHSPELEPERFTLELWAFVPTEHRPSQKTHPWLVCKNSHEQADGNYGIVILDGKAQARMNIGGGRDNAFATATASGQASPGSAALPLKLDHWNHLGMSYDGETLRLFVNGELSGETRIGRARTPGRGGLAFGRRQDNCGDGYHFRGVLDEIRLYHRALTQAEIRERYSHPEAGSPALKPVREWDFRADGKALDSLPSEEWNAASMEIRLDTPKGVLRQASEGSTAKSWSGSAWHEVALAFDPVSFRASDPATRIVVQASDRSSGATRPVSSDAMRGWHCVNLDGIEPILPGGDSGRENNAMERVKLLLENPCETEQIARLMFAKTSGGIRQRIGAPITGISAVLRDAEGNPTGIPVQLSKNWHNRPEAGVYSGQWFHGISQVRLPPRSKIALELVLSYGHWGGVAAASHAQLCLIGWGSNQLWDQSALGSWGESICYEPDQAQAECGILDVRPVMVRSMNANLPWTWTHNVGGGDFFRLFDSAGNRVFPGRMRTAYERYGPCLTEVTYAGQLSDGIEHAATVSLARTDDVVRGSYHLRLDVRKPVDFSRFVIFQIGADTYSYTGERKMALGNESGMLTEWSTQWGGDVYRTKPVECAGSVPWISLHDPVRRRSEREAGAWANRGVVIRSWNATLGGNPAKPWMAERGVNARGADTSTVDILPPPGVNKLFPGDFVEATIEHLIVPETAADYYGPNEELRVALAEGGNTWKMIQREAIGNDRRVQVETGTLERLHPSVTVRAVKGHATLTLFGGLGYVPLTFTGLDSPRMFELLVDGLPLRQSVHGKDFWQTDYDPHTMTWSLTYNVRLATGPTHTISLEPKP